LASPTASAGTAPTRCIPVSTLRWIDTGPAPGRAAAWPIAAIASGVYTVIEVRVAMTSSISLSRGSDRSRMGASMPAARSSVASGTWATASHAAPASSAARATGTAPWP
jgi:hypothetical protein